MKGEKEMFVNFAETTVNSPVNQPSSVGDSIATMTGDVASSTETTTTSEETATFGVISLVTLIVAWFVWNYIDEGETVKEGIKPSNIKANFRNLLVIGLGSTIFISLYKVLVTKMIISNNALIKKIGLMLQPLVIS